MDGLILIDKPKGPTSNQVSIWVKELLQTKTAHSGTLDPNVTGVLPVLLGKGIKLLEYLQEHDKEYACLMQIDGRVAAKKIEKALKEFEGKIYQTPPEMSAVAKKTRVRKIYEITLLEIKDNLVLFKVYCQHGVYIRKLVEDIGHVLGTRTTMLELRRTSSGPFKEKETITLTHLRDAVELKDEKPELLAGIIKPLEFAVQKFPKAEVHENAVKNIANGADVYKPGLLSLTGHVVKGTPVAIMSDDKLIAAGEALFDKKTIEGMKKGAVIKTKKVVASSLDRKSVV